MSDRRKQLNELTTYESANTRLANTDYFIVVDASAANSVSTQTVTMTTLREDLVRTSGPYANDSVAAAAGISTGEMYYGSDGVVKIRLA